MASRFYGVSVGGQQPADVSESGSTTSRSVELQLVYDASGMTKQGALNAIEAIKNYIIAVDSWPPA